MMYNVGIDPLLDMGLLLSMFYMNVPKLENSASSQVALNMHMN